MAPSSVDPFVELTFSDITSEGIQALNQQRLGSPSEVIQSALMSYRLLMINHVKSELAKGGTVSGTKLLKLMDMAGQLYLGRFNRMVGPIAAEAYIGAYRRANAGEVPVSTLYALAEQHSERIGNYYNETSKEALIQGFNTYVNKKVPAKVAADRALDAFGLTPRQMAGYTSLAEPSKISSGLQSLKGKMLSYIQTSLHSRFKIFATQEAYNLDQQATQTAWMWLQSKGTISEVAQKVWLTARDERVCPQCGPLHGQKVGVTEKFSVPGGGELYVPGVHPLCRCTVRLVDPLREVRKDLRGAELGDFNDDHPRDESGRFSAKARAQATLNQRSRKARTQFRPVGFADSPSSALERMVAEAEALRSLPVKPQVVMPEEKQKVEMSQQVVMPRAVSMPQSVTMGQTLDLNSVTMSSAKTTVKMPLKQRIQMKRDTELVMSHITENAPPRRRRVFYRPTIKLERPVYAIASPYEIDQHGQIELTPETEFHVDETQMASDATDYFSSGIEHQAQHIIDDEGSLIEQTTRDGQVLHASLDDDDIWDVVSTIAYRNGGDPDWTGGNATILVHWQDEDGNQMYAERLTIDDVAEHFGLHPEMFEVILIRLTEGHDSSLGRTTQDTHGTKGAYETWTTSGLYQTEVSNKFQVGHSVPITIMDLIPDVDVEEFGNHPE